MSSVKWALSSVQISKSFPGLRTHKLHCDSKPIRTTVTPYPNPAHNSLAAKDLWGAQRWAKRRT